MRMHSFGPVSGLKRRISERLIVRSCGHYACYHLGSSTVMKVLMRDSDVWVLYNLVDLDQRPTNLLWDHQ